MVEVADSGVQVEAFLSAFPPSEALPTSLLPRYISVCLQGDVVIPSCRNHLLVVDVNQAGELSNRSPIAVERIDTNNCWDILFAQQPGQKGLRRFDVPMPL